MNNMDEFNVGTVVENCDETQVRLQTMVQVDQVVELVYDVVPRVGQQDVNVTKDNVAPPPFSSVTTSDKNMRGYSNYWAKGVLVSGGDGQHPLQQHLGGPDDDPVPGHSLPDLGGTVKDKPGKDIDKLMVIFSMAGTGEKAGEGGSCHGERCELQQGGAHHVHEGYGSLWGDEAVHEGVNSTTSGYVGGQEQHGQVVGLVVHEGCAHLHAGGGVQPEQMDATETVQNTIELLDVQDSYGQVPMDVTGGAEGDQHGLQCVGGHGEHDQGDGLRGGGAIELGPVQLDVSKLGARGVHGNDDGGGQVQWGVAGGGGGVQHDRRVQGQVGDGFKEKFRKVYRRRNIVPDGFVQRKIREYTSKLENFGGGGQVSGLSQAKKRKFGEPEDRPGTE